MGVEGDVKNTLWAATSKDVVSGECYEPVGVAGQGKRARLVEIGWSIKSAKTDEPYCTAVPRLHQILK